MEVEFLTETGVCRRETLFSIGDCRHGGLGPRGIDAREILMSTHLEDRTSKLRRQ